MQNEQNNWVKDLEDLFIKVIDNKKVDIARVNDEEFIRQLLDSSYHGAKRLSALPYRNADGDANHVAPDSFRQ